MHLYSTLATASLLLPTAVAQYTLEDDYSPASFASMMNFFTGDDPTHGYVNYLSESASQSAGIYSTDGSSVTLGVDATNVATGRGRDSVRVESLKQYNHGLFILDATHMPEGCGTWPAFWLYGPDWPNGGEVDIVEGVNSQSANSFAAHTGPGCSISSTDYTGTLSTPNCDINAPGQGTNVGCAIQTSDARSYGAGFNANGGGVYATEWTSTAISIWFFPRGSIPADISSGSPSPASWGLPSAQFAPPCDIDQHFSDQRIVINTALCGDWAGTVWASDATCSSAASTCEEFVQNNPSAFQNAYWTIDSLKVYQQGAGASAAPSATVTTPVPTTLSTAVATTTPDIFTPVPSFAPTTAVSISLSASGPSTTLSTTPVVPSTTTALATTTTLPLPVPALPSTFLTSVVTISPFPTSLFLPTPIASATTQPPADAPTYTPSWPAAQTDGAPQPDGQSWGNYGGNRGGWGGGSAPRWGGRPGRRVRL